MSVNIIAQLNPVSAGSAKLTANAGTVADILRELNTGFPLSQARVSLNGEIVTDFSKMAKDGDTLWVKFVPAGSTHDAGVGMKIGGWALAAVGLVLGIALGPTGIGGFIGAAMVGAGVSMAMGGQVLLNVQMPSLKDSEKPENDPSIRGGRNQMRPHGRIPVLFGRHRIYPDLAANPHTSVIGNQQYYTQLFCGGYKDCVIDLASCKLGETSLVELSETKSIAAILAGTDPLIRMEILQNGETSSLYPHCVHENAFNAVLKHTIEGPNGEQLSGHIECTTPDKTDTVNVDIFLYNGIGKYNKDGDLKSASVEVAAFYKPFGAPDSAYRSLGFFNGNNVISGAELKTKRYQITKEGLSPGQYTVKVERLTADSSDSKTVDQVYIGSIRSIKSVRSITGLAPGQDTIIETVRPIRAERQKHLTVIALRVMATGKLNGVIDSFNYIATSRLPVHSGGGTGEYYWLAAAETRNPAAMLLYALRGRAAQQTVDAASIDWQSLEAFYAWCGKHRYTCNAYLSEAVTVAELLRMIGGTARADILRIDSKIAVVQDIGRDSPMQLFTPKNTKSYSVTMLSADVPDAISLRFIDEDAGFAENELAVYNTPDGNRAAEPETTQKTNLWGVTGSDQARRIGMYSYGCLTHRPFVHAIEVDIEYLLCNKGDWIQYAGDIALAGTTQGRIAGLIMADGLCTGIVTDEEIEPSPGRQHAVRIRKADGHVILKEVALVGGRNELYLTEPFAKADMPGVGDIYAFGIRGQEVLDLIITDIQPHADLSATLVCVEYSPVIFRVDDPGFELPAFENKITPVSGAVDSGTVNPDRWKLFVAWHDDEAEPSRPTGDGQSEGWHYAQTLHSVWQSSKMAESVTLGEWGPPVRIKNERSDADVKPVWLNLSVQNKTFECDGDGQILAGSLPFVSQARLFRWNAQINTAERNFYFPGSGNSLFDPLLGDFYPVQITAPVIEWSLPDAPRGITINGDGLITVTSNADLADANSITVTASYQGETHTAVLLLNRDKRVGAPRYLGTIDALPATAAVQIIKGPHPGHIEARQGDYVLAVASGATWQAGKVYQWTGVKWEYRSPDGYADLYMRCFKDGLDVPGLAQDMGWFGAVFARLLIAQQAFIEELQTQVITLKEGGVIQSQTYRQGQEGFRLDANGDVEFNDVNIRGDSIIDGFISAKSLEAGPISVLPAPPKGLPGNFTADETAQNIYNSVRTNGEFTASGTYGGTTINKIKFDLSVRRVNYSGQLNGHYAIFDDYRIYINGSETPIAYTWFRHDSSSATLLPDLATHATRLTYALNFTMTFTGLTLKLLNLSTSIPAENDVVYIGSAADGKKYLMIK